MTRKMDSNQIDAQSPVIVARCGTQDDDTTVKRGVFNVLTDYFFCIIPRFFIGFLFDRAAAKVQLRRFTFGSLSAKALNKMY